MGTDCSTGDSTQGSGDPYGKKIQENGIDVHVSLIHFAVQEKRTL